ncbi:MAG: putative DNA-binding domain-containing protein [Gammaproteobacteria bacterium]
MADLPEFQRQQLAFAAHIRDPDSQPAPPGIEDRRMAIYRDLFFNNVSQLLAKTFPVLHKIHGADAWRLLMRDYFSSHRAHTPLFLEMPREFLQYLEEERGNVPGDPPFQLELAHYEWVELALSIDEREPDLTGVRRDGDLLEGRPVLTPLIWSLRYRFPVHQLGPDYQPEVAPDQPTLLVVHRNIAGKVGFMEINIVTARLLELLGDEGSGCGRQVLETVASEMDNADLATVIDGGRQIFEQLRARELILGVRDPH